jgi:cellulose synthase/poly-beta-1,6-N-acetylglucosamine synthase-like glycosyltransferase
MTPLFVCLRTLGGATGAFAHAAFWGLAGHLTYGAVVGLAGMLRRPRRRPATSEAPLPTLWAIVPAHDEESVIAGIVSDLVAEDYEPGRLTVLVVADHCSDRTAERAERAGATVLVRDSGPRGKSAALAAAARLARSKSVEAIAVFDADNRLREGTLRRLAEHLAGETRVVQGRVDPGNPGHSWVAGASALGFYAIAALVQEPRERLGLSSPLMGTGWAGRLDACGDLLDELGSLTDDLELAALLAGRGIRIAYDSGAVVLDEKPVALATATRQRHRWMQGRWRVAIDHVPHLLRRAASADLSFGERLRTFDVAVQLVAPSLLFSAVSMGLLGAAAWPLRRLGLPAPSPTPLVAGALTAYLLPIPFIARLEPPSEVWRSYFAQPLYLVLSIPLAFTGFVKRGNQAIWHRTPHGGA